VQGRFSYNGPVVQHFSGVGRPRETGGAVLGRGRHYVCGHMGGGVEDLAGGVDVVVDFRREGDAVEVGSVGMVSKGVERIEARGRTAWC
jgi:hypothetical protein